jgi:hypothetical protein
MSDEKRTSDPENTAGERSLYEVMWLSLVITLTNLDDLLKIRDIQDTKEKTASVLSSFDRH